MEADLKWIDRPEVFRVNQMEAHSDHEYYGTEEEYREGDNSLRQSLNGIWRVCYSRNAQERPQAFYREGFDSGSFDEIEVPGHLELAGYDKIHYINTMYPWEGHYFRRPAGCGMKGVQAEGEFSGAEYNPVASYICKFDLQEALAGKRVSILFEGVEQAMYVWLNGTFIGYAEDSFTPSEFDLTDIVRPEGNLLAVEVHKRSTAAYLEDQDFFRFFGIFRNVFLYARPKTHVEDLWLRPQYDPDSGMGEVGVRLKLSGATNQGWVEVAIKEGQEYLILSKEAIGTCIKASYLMPGRVVAWDNQNPYLYQMEARVFDGAGGLVEIVPCRFGFRRIEIRDKVICLNGKRLILNGVNRHEWSAEHGRCISKKEADWDMACIKRNHINAVRTCHYPNQISWYRLCDENGIYMMAETNLESHGSWQKMSVVEPSWNVPGDYPEWEAAVLDRARTNFEVFKNHTSILFWSLGNESYAGEAMRKMHEYYKQQDPERIVHYEGVFHNRAYDASVSEVESRMYAPPQDIREYLDNAPRKPFLLCEYMHGMGNSMGGMSSYMELLDKYEMYQGGFLWDLIDQAVWAVDEVTGKKALRYGGDFDDRPSDYEFSGNGLVFADRTEKPAMQEVRYYYGLYR